MIVGGNNVSSYEAPAFRSAACPTAITEVEPVQGCHNFNPTGAANTLDAITLAPGGGFGLDLQWAEAWGAIEADYDTFVIAANGAILADSVIDNGQSEEPFEFLSYANTTTSAQTVYIVIAKYSGENARLKFVLVGASGITGVQYDTSTGGDIVGPSIFGHNGTTSVGSTAAIPYDNSNTSEDYSSRGPVTLYYQPTPSDTLLTTPQVLEKPDFAATDNVQTAFFGDQVDGTWRFHGHLGRGAASRRDRRAGAREGSRSYARATHVGVVGHGSSRRYQRHHRRGRRRIPRRRRRLASVNAVPAAPTAVTAANGDSQATIRWTAATVDPNYPITGYTISPFAAGVAQAPIVLDTAATTDVVTGLSNGTSYTFTVTATNTNGSGPASDLRRPSISECLTPPPAQAPRPATVRRKSPGPHPNRTGSHSATASRPLTTASPPRPRRSQVQPRPTRSPV